MCPMVKHVLFKLPQKFLHYSSTVRERTVMNLRLPIFKYCTPFLHNTITHNSPHFSVNFRHSISFCSKKANNSAQLHFMEASSYQPYLNAYSSIENGELISVVAETMVREMCYHPPCIPNSSHLSGSLAAQSEVVGGTLICKSLFYFHININ